MQVHAAATRFGGPSSMPAADPFAGLGDLPGLEHVGLQVVGDDAICPIEQPRLARAWYWEGFPDLRESNWLRSPPSALLQPLTVEGDVTRRLSERQVSQAGAKRKRDAPDDPAAAAGSQGHGAHASSLDFADARDGLSLLGAGRHHLRDVVDAIGRALLRAPAACDAEDLGMAMARQLGGFAMAQADLDTALKALMRCVPPPAVRPLRRKAAAVPPVQAVATTDARYEAMGALLRGIGFAMDPGARGLAPRLLQAAMHRACEAGLDPLYACADAAPRQADFLRVGGPLQVMAAMLRLGVTPARETRVFLRQLMSRLHDHLAVWHGAAPQRFAQHARELLASLRWLGLRSVGGREDQVRAFIEAVVAPAGSPPGGLAALGTGLAQALTASNNRLEQTLFLEALVNVSTGEPMLRGDLAWGFLRQAAGDDVAVTLLRLAPALRPLTLGGITHGLALSSGRRAHWPPGETCPPCASWVQACLDAVGLFDLQRTRVLMLGLLHAIKRLETIAPGLSQVRLNLPDDTAKCFAPAHPTGQAVLRAHRIVQEPSAAFDSGPAEPDPANAVELVLLDLQCRPQRPAQRVQDCVDFALRSAAPPRQRLYLLVPLVREAPADVLPRQLEPVRSLIVQGLVDRFAVMADSQALLASESVRGSVDALRVLYRAQAPGWADPRTTAQNEIEALTAPQLPPAVHYALTPIQSQLWEVFAQAAQRDAAKAGGR